MSNEAIQRLRRIETRLTQTMVALGIPTEAQKPAFEAGSLSGLAKMRLPSIHTSLKEVMAALPGGWAGQVELFVGDDFVTMLDVRLGN